jgi:hypothetical protein
MTALVHVTATQTVRDVPVGGSSALEPSTTYPIFGVADAA